MIECLNLIFNDAVLKYIDILKYLGELLTC